MALLPCRVFSPVFYAVYILCGLSDMLDGYVARNTHTCSSFGEKLDTVADFFMCSVCMMKIVPELHLSYFVLSWTGVIMLIKSANIVFVLIKRKQLAAVHSVLNRIAGIVLFIMPLTLPVVGSRVSTMSACAVATCAALSESYILLREGTA